jgi:purine-cytosine permease-like protein
MLPVILFPGIPLIILAVYFYILNRLEHKYSIGDISFLFHLSSLIISIIVFTWILANIFPYKPLSENPPSTEMEYHLLWISIAGAFFSGLLTIILHFVIRHAQHQRTEANN